MKLETIMRLAALGMVLNLAGLLTVLAILLWS